VTPLLELRAVSLSFGGVQAVRDLDLTLAPGEIVSLVGPNGAGKSSVVDLVTGVLRPAAGDILLQGRSILGLPPHEITARGIARTFQTLRLFSNMTVKENVMAAAWCHTRCGVLSSVLRTRAQRREEREIERLAEHVLGFFAENLGPRRWGHPAYSLSYANRRRLELARALATRPRLLLLDEPAAGMSPVETREAAALLALVRAELGCTMLVVEHDMDFVERVSDRVVALVQGAKVAEGSFADVAADPRVLEAYLGRRVAAGPSATAAVRSAAR
jgi:branched-chain amino acid transport system ATP-binding protein